MRLIDADKIYQILENKSSYGYVSALDISSIEIVDAIPIEWIVKWYRRALDNSGFMGDETISVGDLLADWEKENDKGSE